MTCTLGLAIALFQGCSGVGIRGNGVPTPFFTTLKHGYDITHVIVTRRFAFVQWVLTLQNLTKNPLIYSVS